MEKRLFKGQYTNLHEASVTDVFFDIVCVLERGFEFEVGDKHDLDYLLNSRKKCLVITENNKALFVLKMTACEKVSCETVFDKKRAMELYGISEHEWTNTMDQNPEWKKCSEPMKRTYNYSAELTIPEEDCKKFFDIGFGVLMEIN